MLLASVILLVVAGKLAERMAKEPPRPQPAVERGEWQVKEAKTSAAGGGRWSGRCGCRDAGSGDDPVGEFRAGAGRRRIALRIRRREADAVASFPRSRRGGRQRLYEYPDLVERQNGAGILWKTPLPLKGHSSPVVWGDKVFLSAADPNVRQVLCFDGKSGRLLWTGDVPTAPLPSGEKFEIMEDTGYAACTVATDGRRVYAIFPTGDVAGFDFNGRRLWHKSLGRPDSSYGYASSLETYEKLVLIDYDQSDGKDGKSRLYALDGLDRAGCLGGESASCRARGQRRLWWTWRASRS